MFSDLMTFNFPLKSFYSDCLKNRFLSLWTPYLGNGFPIFAAHSLGGLYPPNLLLYYFLPPLQAFNLFLLVHLFLAGGATYLFCRSTLLLSRFASLIAGLTFALNGFFIIHFIHPDLLAIAAWFPVTLLLASRLKKRPLSSTLLLGIILGNQILIGHFRFFYLSYFFLCCYLLLQSLKVQAKPLVSFPIRPFLLLGLSLLIGLLLAAPQVLASWELFSLSASRSLSFDQSTYIRFPRKFFLTFFSPKKFDFDQNVSVSWISPSEGIYEENIWESYAYLGIGGLILALTAIFTQFTKDRKTRVFTFLMIFSFLFVLGKSTPFFKILWSVVPGMKFYRNTVRALIFANFSIAILAGIGGNLVLQKIKTVRPIPRPFFTLVKICLVFLVFLDLYFHQHPINQVVDAGSWFAPPKMSFYLEKGPTADRIDHDNLLGTNSTQAKNISLQFELKELLPANFNQLFKIPSIRNRTEATTQRSDVQKLIAEKKIVTPDFHLTSSENTKLLGLLNVGHLLTTVPRQSKALVLKTTLPFKEPRKALGITFDKVYLYENTHLLPRAFYVPQARSFDNPESLLLFLQSPEFEPTKTVLLEEEVNWGGKPSDTAVVQIVKFTPHEIELLTESPDKGFLFLSETFYPGWQAYVNGEETKIYRANYNFRAVRLEAGTQTVRFVYNPKPIKIGFLISLLTGALISVFLFLRNSLKNKNRFQLFCPK